MQNPLGQYNDSSSGKFIDINVTIKEVAEATGLPIFPFKDCYERERKQVPHLLLVANLRFSMEAILQ